jgi:hypothetical protein
VIKARGAIRGFARVCGVYLGRFSMMAQPELPVGSFKIEQFPFYLEPPAETHQAAVTADHPVAWNDDGEGISGVCPAHCAGGLWPSDALRQLTV